MIGKNSNHVPQIGPNQYLRPNPNTTGLTSKRCHVSWHHQACSRKDIVYADQSGHWIDRLGSERNLGNTKKYSEPVSRGSKLILRSGSP